MLLLDYKPWNWLRILLCPLPLREGSSIRLARPGPASLAGIRWSEPEQRVPKRRERDGHYRWPNCTPAMRVV